MGRTTLRTLAAMSVLLMALFVTGLAPALAKGGQKADPGYTEDNDTNDNDTPNNVSDEGDNHHPSGKDRSVEYGGSGNQGRSSSDPDDDGRGPDRTNGGPDKPNGSGGADKADQDNNNGCGNDDDFEDDNEGWCGPRDKSGPTTTRVPLPLPTPTPTPSSSIDTVLPGVEEKPGTPDLVLGETIHKVAPGGLSVPGVTGPSVLGVSGPSVLGDRLNPGAKAATLPFTGGNLITFIIIAMGLIVAGGLVMRARRAS